MIEKHSCYEYEVYGTNVDTDNEQFHFVIYDEDDNIESDDWYDTRQEAKEAAIEKINDIENGPDEPDYDQPSINEQSANYWQQRRELGE